MKHRALVHTLLLLAAAAASLSCLQEIEPVIPESAPFLSIRPSVSNDGKSVSTKAKEDTDPSILKDDEVLARTDLRENFFGSLDIFVKRQSAAESDPWFKEYHLNAGDSGVIVDPSDSESLLNQAKQALASNWAKQGYVPDTLYNIYVTANNPHTAASVAPANLTALKALRTHKEDIFRYYLNYTPSQTDPAYWTNCMYSEKKNFLMDGTIEGWTIDPSTAEQVFDVGLKRAAAKIVLTVNFSSDKTIAMITDRPKVNGVPQPPDTLFDNGRVTYGSVKEYMTFAHRTAGEPRFKPVNFCLDVSDLAYSGDTTPSTDTLVTASGNFTTFIEGNSADNTDNTFALVTYTYPVDWSSDSKRTPYILLSVFYTRTEDGDQLRSYYRIPVCDETTVTSLERDKIYIIDVEIASLGASNESFEAKDEELRIEYHVIPWTETNVSQEATTVKISDTKYLTVIPTEYILTGDNTQSVDLQWFASVSTDDNRIVDIDESTLAVWYYNYLGDSTSVRGTVTKQVRNDQGTLVTATNANTDGKRDIVITATAPNNSTTAKGEKVVITLTPNGIIRVESDALLSRAIKNIKFKVHLKNGGGVDPVDINIRHFPLDNIQSIAGLWSSRWDGQKGREYSFNPTADGWTEWDGYEDDVECTQAEYNSASDGKSTDVVSQPVGTPSDYDSRSDIESGENGSSMQTAFRNAVPQNSRYGANSEANAYHDTATDYWYWGTDQVTGSTNNYDWRDNGNSGTRRRWTTYYRRKFYKNVTVYYARRYYRAIANYTPGTGTWVEWGGNDGTTSAGIYTAKVYYNGQCYAISDHDSRGSGYSNLTNNHMYVLQVTSTSDKYVIGKPVLDSNYQSQDKVVSPAFMIASQLGAVNPTTSPTDAATHCGTYMEVSEDGTRYVGWRLPTKQEIEVMISYQSGSNTQNITMVTVLGGQYYWSLDGTSAYVSTGSNGTATNAYVRCVRDLTLDEVNSLNNTNN